MTQYTAENLKTLVTNKKAILNWGPAMSGKTRSLHTLILWLKERKLGPLHLYDIDEKCESLVNICEKLGLLDHLVVFQYRSKTDTILGNQHVGNSPDVWMQWMTDINRYSNKIDPATKLWKSDYNGPGAVVIDTLTSFDELTTSFVMSQLGHNLGDKNTSAQADYGKIIKKVFEAIKYVRALPCITVWNGHEQILQDDTAKEIARLPYMTGTKAPSTLPGKFNVVLYSDYTGSKYIWRVKPDPTKYIRVAGTTSRDDLEKTIEQDYRLLL